MSASSSLLGSQRAFSCHPGDEQRQIKIDIMKSSRQQAYAERTATCHEHSHLLKLPPSRHCPLRHPPLHPPQHLPHIFHYRLRLSPTVPLLSRVRDLDRLPSL